MSHTSDYTSGKKHISSGNLPSPDETSIQKELVRFSSKSVQTLDILSVQFQKFTFTKLILRLLTDIVSQSQSAQSLELSGTNDNFLNDSSRTQESETGSASIPHDNDALGFIHQQLNSLLRPLIRESLLKKKSHFLRVEPPILSHELDELVVGLSALGKLYLSEIVAESCNVMFSKTYNPSEKTRLEPFHVDEALQALNAKHHSPKHN